MRSLFPLVGFHGCTRNVAKKVLLGRDFLKRSEGSHEWLGDGIYFWENDPVRALEWAKYRKLEDPYVVGALIVPQEIIDFSTRESVSFLEKAAESVRNRFSATGMPLPKNQPFGVGDKFYKNRRLDCLVMNALEKMNTTNGRRKFDVFMAPFIEGKEIYLGGMFHAETHVQFCVKNPECIVGTFVPVNFLKRLGLSPI